jgi:DNA polymerase/3'-5' exonuclease PolX
MEYREALFIANRLVGKLESACTKVYIAGSIRRKKSEVKDIEICCLPKKYDLSDGDLFDPTYETVPIPEFEKIVNSLGKIIKGNSNGRYMQIYLPERINLDLFIPVENDFYRQYCIRTGSADYSKTIAQQWNKLGWCGSDFGLRKMSDCIKVEGQGWKCINKNGELPPIWKNEKEFYSWLKLDYIEPEYRNVTNTIL